MIIGNRTSGTTKLLYIYLLVQYLDFVEIVIVLSSQN